MTPEELADLLRAALAELDGQDALPQHEWIAAISHLFERSREAGVVSDELRYELFAAEVILNERPCVWGTLFGPFMSVPQADGTRLDAPSRDAITAAAIDHWNRRMDEVEHPLLRSRYADLVWDFSETLFQLPRPFRAAQLAIDSYVDSVVTGRADLYGGFGDHMRRALALAAMINDRARQATAVTRFEEFAAAGGTEEETEYRQRKLLRLLTDTLRPNRRPTETIQRLTTALRARLDALAAVESDHLTLEKLALPLAEYYRENGQLGEAQTVLRMYGTAVFRLADRAMALVGIAWLRQLHAHYLRYEMPADAADVLARIETRQPEVPGNLVPVRIPMEVDAAELEEFLDYVVTDELPQSVLRLVIGFLPNVEEQIQQMQQLAADHPLAALYGGGILVAGDGREIARLGAADDDDVGRLIHHLSQGYGFASFYLRQAFARLRERLAIDAETLFNYCTTSSVWPADRRGVLRRGLEAYLNDDHVVATHLLVTELENAVRNIARLIRAPLQKVNRHGGLDLRTFGDLLADGQVKQCLGVDVALYMESVLTDRRGWNLRNTTCHGIRPFADFHPAASDRLMHVVLMLSLLHPLAEEVPADAPPQVLEGGETGEPPVEPPAAAAVDPAA
jgi:hypothetical protein